MPRGAALLGELVLVRRLRLVGRVVAVVGDEALVQPALNGLPAAWFALNHLYASKPKASQERGVVG